MVAAADKDKSGFLDKQEFLALVARQWEHLDSRMRAIIPRLHTAMHSIIPMVDADTDAFNDYMVIRH